jgi:uncharacterized membrane-anchored protein
MSFDKLATFILNALAVKEVKYIVYTVAANVILAVAASIKTGTFRLGYLANFVKSKLLPYLLGFMAALLVAQVQTNLSSLPTAIWAAIELALIGDILSALKEIGLPVPEQLT